MIRPSRRSLRAALALSGLAALPAPATALEATLDEISVTAEPAAPSPAPSPAPFSCDDAVGPIALFVPRGGQLSARSGGGRGPGGAQSPEGGKAEVGKVPEEPRGRRRTCCPSRAGGADESLQ